MDGNGFHSALANLAQMCTADWHEEKIRTYLGLTQSRAYIWERIAKGLFLLWQTTVHLRAVCRGVIPVVANRGIEDRFATKGWNPVPTILYRQFPCSRRHIFLMRDFTSVKPIPVRGGLFKGIVSRDFVVCFLVSFDRSDIYTPQEWVLLLLKVRFRIEFFDFRVWPWWAPEGKWRLNLSNYGAHTQDIL
jgi:hypothetical protein